MCPPDGHREPSFPATQVVKIEGLAGLDDATHATSHAQPCLLVTRERRPVDAGRRVWHGLGHAALVPSWYDAFLLEEYLLALSGQYYWLKLAIVALDIVLFNAVSIGWYLATVVFYTHTLYTVSLVQGSLLQADTRWRAQLTDQRNHYRSMRTLWHRVTILRQTFDQVFSLQPFLWFVCLFIECSLTLILFKYDYHRYASQSTLTVVLDNWSLYIMRALFVCGAAVVVDQVNARADTLFSSFSADLLSGDHRHCQLEVFFLLTEVRQTLHMSATCWGMFQLNKSALLVFANSVIPFSVLVLNLADTVNGGQAA
ncbi:hypothetical protein HDE_10924 [Halotydeus destructor]|nr:hypothetical protein HDE_10924 [Halotydeus destructor]